MKKVSILKHNLMRAAMTLALIMTCAAAWAQPKMQTFTKDIIGYENYGGGWYLIASPIGAVNLEQVEDMFSNDYDLYRFNQAANNEWENYKALDQNDQPLHPDFTTMKIGHGYLYANSENVTLTFIGSPYSDEGKVTLTKIEGASFEGWNLVGNPFGETAYIIDARAFYVMNADRSEIEVADRSDIAPMEGIFVYAEYDDDEVEFTTQEPGKGRGPKPEIEQVVLNLSRERGNVIDRAIVRFNESRQLPKFQIRENSTKLYLPQDGKDYAIATSNGQGEMPVNFRAKENGNYTITVNTDHVEMSYLHLIDNMTGNDVDLLATKVPEPVEGPTLNNVSTSSTTSYTFTAKTTDYESRFKLVFVANGEGGPSTGSGTFAFMSDGNWIIANEGEAILQVIDINGRILSSESINGSVSKSIEAVPGVYVLRLVNGSDVKTQKIVVR